MPTMKRNKNAAKTPFIRSTLNLTYTTLPPVYEGHSINKLQSGVSWLFLKRSKIPNICLVGNLFPYSHENFFITMMSLL